MKTEKNDLYRALEPQAEIIDHDMPVSQEDNSVSGRVMPPLILWFLGVPGFLCVLLWLFFFRGGTH